MTETDSDAMLLENIEGKYGDGSDYDDLVNADEDALLADDAEFLTIKHSQSQLYDDTAEELDHEPEEADTEDVLDLEAQDVELEEDLEEKNAQLSLSINSASQLDLDNSHVNDSREREDKFKNERELPPCKSKRIPDSLEKVQVVASVPSVRNNMKRNTNQFKTRGRGGNHGNRNAQNQTVLINPHFKGHVKINNNTWDARQRLNQKNNQVGRIAPFVPNRNPNQNVAPIQPWTNNGNNNRGLTPNLIPQFPQHQLQVYNPPVPQPLQGPLWDQYQTNSYNEVPQQMPMNNNQLVFMQPIPPNVYSNQPIQPQFNQPPPPFTPYNTSPMYSNSIQNPGFANNQFMPPPNQFNHHMEPPYTGYPTMQQNQYSNVPINNTQFNHQVNPFNNSNNRIIRQKLNYAYSQKMNKRKPEASEVKRKKRNLTSTNLHEVPTVEACDTTAKEEKIVEVEEEDDETREYRLKIEEQKKKREQICKLKEERRLKAIQNGSVGDTTKPGTVQLKKAVVHQQQVPHVRSNQTVRPTVGPIWMQQQIANRSEQICNSNININTNSDESNYDKQHLQSFLANRKILTKDQSLIDTSIVVMKNLSAGTTEIKLRKMCQGIGDIKVKVVVRELTKPILTIFDSLESDFNRG